LASASPQSKCPLLSAGKSKPFQLLPEDYKDPVLEPRLSASKRASLEAPAEFEAAVVEKVKGFLSAEKVQIVGVIVNRVGSARAIFEVLRTDEQSEVILLTGRARSYDREILLKERLALAASGRNRTQALSRSWSSWPRKPLRLVPILISTLWSRNRIPRRFCVNVRTS